MGRARYVKELQPTMAHSQPKDQERTTRTVQGTSTEEDYKQGVSMRRIGVVPPFAGGDVARSALKTLPAKPMAACK
jgi:hypothetical protein